MKASIKPGYTQKRQQLCDIIPLEAPFTLFISATQACNFRCFYCTQSKSDEEKAQMGFSPKHIEPELFDMIVKQAGEFKGKIKRVLFTGLGEPLANPRLPAMIGQLSDAGVAQSYEVVSNGYLLTHNMADSLIEAGITYLRISIQGLSAEKYEEITGVRIDYERLLDNLKYFYEHKGNCKLYIKIMDACLDGHETKEQFYQLFGDICDEIYIEHLIKAQPSMMDEYGDNVKSELTFYGDPAQERKICPFIFYTLQVDASGNTYPCPPLGFPEEFSLGSVRERKLKDIWDSKNLYELQMKHLRGQKSSIPICGACENYLCFTPEEDNLDHDAHAVMARLKERKHV